MSISIDRNRMHEMLAELGALVTTRPGPDATAPPSSWIAFRDRIVALPEVEAVSTVRRFRVEVAGQPTDIAVYEMAPGSYRGFRFKEGVAGDLSDPLPLYEFDQRVTW